MRERLEKRLRHALCVVVPALSLLALPTVGQAGRLLLGGQVTERDAYVELTVEFGCGLRYQSHAPASSGAEVRVVLRPDVDCGLSPQGSFPTERQLPADSVGLVRALELVPGLTGGAELHIQWNRVEQFTVAPTPDQRGLSVRVSRVRKSSAQLVVDDSKAAVGSFAINLMSSKTPIPTADIARARTLLKVPVYVSQVEINGEPWQRLRAGPFFSKGAAEKVMAIAEKAYAGVWIGIDDEARVPEATRDDRPASGAAKAPPGAAAETVADPQLDDLLDQARKENSRKQYDRAIVLLQKILLVEGYARRSEAQELLGLSHERNRQFAHAQDEYEEYLRRYPEGPAADRIRSRLKAIRQSTAPGRAGTGGDGSSSDASAWQVFGTIDQTWRRDNSQLRAGTLSRDFTSQNSLISDVDFLARHRGERYDFTARVSAGYLNDFMPNGSGRGDQQRVTTAYAELRDKEQGWGVKAGRQSRGMAGIFNTFDGLVANWQWRPQVGFSVVGGMPVESSRDGIDSHRRFGGVAVDLSNPSHTWDTSLYAITQQYYGETDRQSVGVETRYLKTGRTVVALLDYDVHFSEINNAMFLGTLAMPSQYTLSLSAGHQRSPTLSLRNALIGQPVVTFDELRQIYSPAQIDALAKDRTATLNQGSVSLTHPLGERAQWTLSAYTVDISGMPASGGVEAIAPFGVDTSLTGELLYNGLLRQGDASTAALRYQQGGGADTWSLGLSNRMPLGESWRLLTRLRADHRQITNVGTVEWLYAPSFRLDFLRRHGQLELEAGAEFGDRTTNGFTERNTRYYFSLGYRLSLDSFWR
ncbi:MAG: hypothetical protein RLZZ393_1220 [Pseudomonadota bacterium]|jgi:hypothetical protein